jgi:hypothetical protein
VIARILAVAYVSLAAFAALVFVQSGLNYVNVTEVTLNMRTNIEISSLQINWTGNVNDSAVVYVTVNVTNPGKIAVLVMSLEFDLHMDRVQDPRPWYDAGKLRDTRVQSGGILLDRAQALHLAPSQSGTLHVETVVAPGSRMSDFDVPDGNGLYHPVLWGPVVVYGFVDFETTGAAYLPPYYVAQGVAPVG